MAHAGRRVDVAWLAATIHRACHLTSETETKLQMNKIRGSTKKMVNNLTI